MKLSAMVVLAAALGGCSLYPRTYVFQTPRPHDEDLDLLARRLDRDGHNVSTLDRHNGQIVTRWESLPGQATDLASDDRAGALFVRYHVEVQTVQVDHAVRVWAEAKSCAPETVTITPSEVIGGCRELLWIPSGVKAAVDELGRQLSAQLAAPATAPALAAASCPP